MLTVIKAKKKLIILSGLYYLNYILKMRNSRDQRYTEQFHFKKEMYFQVQKR